MNSMPPSEERPKGVVRKAITIHLVLAPLTVPRSEPLPCAGGQCLPCPFDFGVIGRMLHTSALHRYFTIPIQVNINVMKSPLSFSVGLIREEPILQIQRKWIGKNAPLVAIAVSRASRIRAFDRYR